ncbi:MAG: hypothetical protein M3033_17225, partial [Acidobacteriota bacterium]|nr:hypothetical protein [Acidobacteriota bacterium]
PTPTPPILVAFVSPQSVYAGSKTFRLEVNGDKFTPDSVIVFSNNQLPTTFVSPQKLIADVPSNFISGQGSATVMVNTPDGKLYSNPFILNIQAPPRPQLQYIGMIARKRANNDTAYFQEQGKNVPFAARLNDVVGGRFRVVSISPSEVIFEDVTLSFRHKIALLRPPPGQGTPNNGAPNNGAYNPYNPNVPTYNYPPPPQGDIPGIPSNIPRYVPPQPQQKPSATPNDDDDDGNN